MTATTATLAELFADVPEELRRQALSHSSWVETRTKSYGRLAFLGDSVLGLSVAALLFNEHPDADIGELTKILNQAVSGRACADVARELGLPGMLAAQSPDEGDGLPVETLLSSERTLASVCEAVIGAAYLSHGFEPTSRAVVEAFHDEVQHATRERLDFKSELQERLARDGDTVNYEVIGEKGPPHDRRFEVLATVDGEEIGSGSGRSKKEAEQAAAQLALDKLRK
jgi:ribonuclease III